MRCCATAFWGRPCYLRVAGLRLIRGSRAERFLPVGTTKRRRAGSRGRDGQAAGRLGVSSGSCRPTTRADLVTYFACAKVLDHTRASMGRTPGAVGARGQPVGGLACGRASDVAGPRVHPRPLPASLERPKPGFLRASLRNSPAPCVASLPLGRQRRGVRGCSQKNSAQLACRRPEKSPKMGGCPHGGRR